VKARLVAFMTVGILGWVVQISALALLSALGWGLAAATAVAVELAVLHNFWWHQRWTWRERTGGGPLRRLVRFQATTGLTSLVSNVALTTALARLFDLNAVAANTCAVAIVGLVNFVLADRLVFSRRDRDGRDPRGRPPSTLTGASDWPRGVGLRGRGTAATVAALAAIVLTAGRAHASPGRHTLDAWTDYVSNAEARIAARHAAPCVPGREPLGDAQGVAGGTVHRWRGCTAVTGYTVDALLDALQHPGTPPPQEDILESRVLARTPELLRVYLKLKRRAVLTVTYDTEHDVTFSRPSADVATSRSVATSIAEVGGDDRGFLWRLNSYWRYVQVGPDVRVELESLSLSRPVPLLLRPVASPLISSVARESVTRALDALRSYTKSDLMVRRLDPAR
jgi:putative flippase GtrA